MQPSDRWTGPRRRRPGRAAARLAAVAACGIALCGCRSLRGLSSGPAGEPVGDAQAAALAHYALALIHETEKGWNSPEAMAELRRAMALDPSAYRVYARAAAVHLHRKETDQALALLREACRMNPDDVQAVADLAVTCEAYGLLDEATARYREALALAPTHHAIYCQLARALFKARKDSEALDIIRRGLRRAERPQVLLLYCYNTGVDFIASKQFSRAIACLQTILGMDPLNTPRLHVLIGEMYESLGDTRAAIRHLGEALDDEKSLPEAYLRLAGLYARTDMARAQRTLEDGASRFPTDASLAFSLGLLLSQRQTYEAAIAAFQKARALAAGDKDGQLSAAFFLHYGAAHERAGRIREAADIFKECLALYPDDHAVLNYLAYMWAEADMELDAALGHVRRALALQPDNGAYVDTLGWVLFRQKKLDAALEQIRKASELDPDDPTILDHLGDVHAAAGRTDAAVDCWGRSYLRDPSNRSVEAKLTARGVDAAALRRKAAQVRRKEPDAAPRARAEGPAGPP